MTVEPAGSLILERKVAHLLSLPALERRQWWSPGRLRLHQERELRKLVRRAWEHVPFYRELWDQHAVSPNDIRTVDDLAKLPVVPSELFKGQPADRTRCDDCAPQRCFVKRTSGSTGHALSILYDPYDYFVLVKAASARFRRAHGVKLRHRIARFSPEPEAVGDHAWYERLGIWRTKVLPTAARAHEWVRQLRDFQPHVLAGMPHSVLALVDEIEAEGVPGIAPGLVTTSGMVLSPADRQAIETRLRARVVDTYGAYEAGFIAWQCPVCPGYHVNADNLIVEILVDGRPASPGEVGDVVITNLRSTAMPIIRYALGDLAAPSDKEPACGRCLPLIHSIMGRNNDFIHLPSGRRVELYKISSPVLRQTTLREWRFIQEASGNCVLLAVPPEPGKPLPHDRELLAAIRNSLGDEVEVRIELCKSIYRDPATKWKTVVSHYKPQSGSYRNPQ
jgi:phenylacetate-CoA ligase